MKTPDEIKKGLAGCNVRRCAKDCPYGDTIPCVMMMHKDACEYVQQLEAQVPKWISVKERLPETHEDGSVDAALVTDGDLIHMAYFSSGKWFYCSSGEMKENMFYEVTHWMPLPEPPKEE